jgi:hypothetical protein
MDHSNYGSQDTLRNAPFEIGVYDSDTIYKVLRLFTETEIRRASVFLSSETSWLLTEIIV